MIKKIIDFSHYCSIGIGEKNEVNILESKDVHCQISQNGLSFQNKISFLKDRLILNDKKYQIIGGGNNILVSPNAKNILILGNDFDYILDLGDFVEIGASAKSYKVFKYFKDNNLTGLEFLAHLPGTIGGLCNMNAGMKEYEMKSIIRSLNINGEWIKNEHLGFTYRGRKSGGIIIAARFNKIYGFKNEMLDIFKKMRSNQPKVKSCGSCFKNPPNDFAGRLLEICNMKGYNINGVGFSDIHANFLVNTNKARFNNACENANESNCLTQANIIKNNGNTAKDSNASYFDALKVIEIAQKKVYEKTGIKLECEVRFIV